MSDLDQVLQQCLARGIRLAQRGGELRVTFDGPAPDAELLALLKRHKPQLLRHLCAAREGATTPIPRLDAAARARVPASAAQRRLWLLDRMEKSAAPYNMVGAFRLRGPVDLDALAAALDAVVARHEALRTNLVEIDGELWQVLCDAAPLVWDRSDVSGATPEQQQRALEAVLERENAWRFDLAGAPPLRASSVRLAPDHVVWLLNVHHVACDGWSIEILKRELAAAYAAHARGAALDLPPPRVHYADYTQWQRARAHDAELERQLVYWKRQLDGLPPLHGLPLDKPRPATQTYRGEQLCRRLPAAVLRDVTALCRAHDATLFMLLGSALCAVLSLYSGERDLAFGFPVAGRRHRDADDTVGLFVNTLVLRCAIDGDPTFGELLAANRRTVLDALAHQDTPFERLIEELKPGRSRAHGPLVQILLAVQSQVERDFALAGLAVEPLANAHAPVKFDLQIVAEPVAHELELRWQFNADLFEHASIARMADCCLALIERASRDPSLRLSAVPGYVAPDDHAAESRALAPPERLEHAIERQAQAWPDRTAVACADDVLTYRELDGRANALAARLRALGAGRGRCVGLYVERSTDMVVGVLGTLKAGAAYVPLDPTYPPQRLAAMIADCDAPVLLSQRAFEREVSAFGRPVLWLDETSGSVVTQRQDAGATAHDPAYVIYTSGTTGVPKGVLVPHASVARLLRHFDAQAPLDAPCRGSLWSSICFDVSVYELFAPLVAGGCLDIVPAALRLDPERLFRWLDQRAVTSTFLYAGYIEPFAAHLAQAGGGAALRRMLVGVEPIASDHLAAIAQRLPQLAIVNGYGPTEATVCCTTLRFQARPGAPNRRVPIGRAVDGAELFVLNAGGEPAPLGAIGELHVGGAGLALGYLNKPELTRERFVEKHIAGRTRRLYRTGDLVRYLPSGDLEFIGRADEQIKVRGFRIEPGEIEVRLCQQAAISDAAVLALGEGVHKRLVAYVVPKADAAAAIASDAAFAAEVKQALKAFLPDYMLPDEIVLLERIPMTPNGKVDRAALPQPAPPASGADAFVAPANATEQALVEIWQDVLGVERVGTRTDFFALGGHSLHLTRLLSRVRRQFALQESDLSLEDVFAHPTVAALAQVVDAAQRRSAARSKAAYLASLGQDVEEGVF